MKQSDWITIGCMVLSILFTTIGSTIYLAFKIGGVNEKVISLERRVEKLEVSMEEMKKDISDLKSDMREVKFKLDILWRRYMDEAYPRSAPGNAALKAATDSEVVQFAEQQYNEILSQVIALKPDNAAQTEEALISIVGYLKTGDSSSLELRKSALAKGQDIDSLLWVAALSIRDRVIADLGFKK